MRYILLWRGQIEQGTPVTKHFFLHVFTLAMAALPPNVAARPGHVYELDPTVSKRLFGDTGVYARMGVEGNGSCFYFSICAILNIDDFLHQTPARQMEICHTFRCQFQRAFTEQQFKYLAAGTAADKSFAATKEALCMPEVWADEVMIKHAASVLNMNLVFLDMSKATMYCGVHGAETLEASSPRKSKSGGKGKGRTRPQQPTGVIAWVSKSHFEPIVRYEGSKGGQALVRGLFEPAKNDDDATMVAHLMTAYARQCSESVHDAHV